MKAPLILVTVAAALAATTPGSFAAVSPSGYRLITDTLGGNGHAKPSQVQGYRFITDTLGGNGGVAAATPAAGAGFQWGDAGIGAAASAGSILVLLGGSLVRLRRRSQLAL